MIRAIVVAFFGLAAVAFLAPVAGMAGEMATALGTHVGAVLAGIGGWAVFKRRKIEMAVSFVALAMLLVTCGRVPSPGTPSAGDLEVVVVNAYEYNEASEAAIVTALEDKPIVLLIEPRPGLVDVLSERFRVPAKYVHDTKFDLAVLVRDDVVVETATVHRFVGLKSVVGEIVVGGHSIVFVHVPAPTAKWQQEERGLLAKPLADLLNSRGRPVIVAGDFNAAPASPLLAAIAKAAKLRLYTSSPTWPASFGPFGIPIDHVLATEDARLGQPVPFELPGSDHKGWRFSISPRPRGS